MEIRTKFYLQVQISNSIIVFLSSVPEITFWEKLVLKLQSALFKMKLDTRGYSILLILSFSRIAFLNFILTKPFLGQIWSQNFKVLCLEWNSVQRSIQGCRFWIQLFFFLIFSIKYLLGIYLVAKLQSVMFEMELGSKAYSRLLIPNLQFFFVNSPLKIPFRATLAAKLQTALFKMKRSTKGYSRGLISNSTIVFLNSVHEIPF